MQEADILWVTFVEIENAEVTIFAGDKTKFAFNEGSAAKMYF